MIADYIKLCRPSHHLAKNLLILLPPFFGHKMLEEGMLYSALGAWFFHGR